MNSVKGNRSAAVLAFLFASVATANTAAVVDQSKPAAAPSSGLDVYQIFGSPVSGNLPGAPTVKFFKSTGIQSVTDEVTGRFSAVDLPMTSIGAQNLTGRLDLSSANKPGFDANGLGEAGNILGKSLGNDSSRAATGGVASFDLGARNNSFNSDDRSDRALGNPDTFDGVSGWSGTSNDAPGAAFNPTNFTPKNYAGGNDNRDTNSINGVDPAFVPQTDLAFRTYVSSVPEPATWAMMILGFGLVGGSMRRRNTLTVKFA